ncbi:MAG: zinc metallopeptidase [Thermoleophilia bacterium]|jgi:Zn-dependent membrane protease YugP
MFFDYSYLLYVLVPTLIISGVVQWYLRSTFAKWRQVRNSAGETGRQVGEVLFARTGLDAVPFQRATGQLSDHFDPRANVVRLSDTVAGQPSVASMAIVAHELGHVQQQQSGSALMEARNFLVPALTVSPKLAFAAIFGGLILRMTGLIWVGVALFGVMVLFSLLTLPVEIDASRRGLRLLHEAGFMQTKSDISGSRQVLTAAALTYVAAAVTAIMQLVYFVTLARRSS